MYNWNLSHTVTHVHVYNVRCRVLITNNILQKNTIKCERSVMLVHLNACKLQLYENGFKLKFILNAFSWTLEHFLTQLSMYL